VEIQADLVAFVKSVFSHWEALMTGFFSLVITFWEKMRNRPLATRIFHIIAVGCIFTAFFFAWRDEHEVAKPTIKVDIDAIDLHPIDINHAGALLTVHLINTGEPTALQKWQLTVRLEDGKEFKGELLKIPETFTLRGEMDSVKYHGADDLAITSLNPLPKGKISNGIIYFQILLGNPANRELANIFPATTLFILSFRDAHDNLYTATTKLGILERHHLYPGMNMEILPPQ
jgi:hypothetical protein